jgi:hypothetical protein
MKFYLVWALVAFIAAPAYSQVNSTKLFQEGSVVCPEDKNGTGYEYCTYTLVHLTRAQELIRKVEQVLFKGDPLTSPDGMMEPLGNNRKVLTFWHINKDILQRMKDVIPMLDTKESFYPNTIVEFKADVYEVSETGLSNLGAEITNLKVGKSITDGSRSATMTGVPNGLGLDLKLGIIELSGLLSAEKQKGNLRRKVTITRPVANLSSIEYDDKTKRYAAPGAGTSIIKDEYTGVTLDGVVSVNDEDSSLVTIKNFKFTYGTLNSDNTVNMITLPSDDLIVKEGIAFPLVSSKTVGSFSSTTTSLFGLRKEVTKEDAKLLIYVSVKVKSWDNYIDSIQDLLTIGKQKFDKEELETLSNNCISDMDLLNDITPIATRDHQGDPVLSIKLNKENACLKNIKNRIKVSFTGNGIPKAENKKNVTVESLMHIPVKINGLSMSKVREKSELKIKLKLEMINKGVKTKMTHRLKFAPSDYDIEDNFWLE